ncbi:ankyrin [Aspergillus ellipticus CBS 707.79]|uniref:Ankyrin n=1 Tax=Aspergillus ellipticus CBS 707.79 TaxID=1448320 RepID=A0A319ESU5_9EURO|nr:ankyrin [Aspergillus ellipticus CBS 707.79]
MQLEVRSHIPANHGMSAASTDEARALRLTLASQFPFLQYAVDNALYHADVAEGGGISQTNFLESFQLRDWITFSNVLEKYQVRRYTPLASLLYILAEYNFANLIINVRLKVSYLHIPGERYHYPIAVALTNANDAAVSVLLELNEELQRDEKFGHCIQPMYDKEIVNLLRRKKSRTSHALVPPMSYLELEDLMCHVAKNDQQEIFNFLLAAYQVDFAIQSKIYRQGPFHVAIEHGRQTMGRTPLWLAIEHGNEAILRLLWQTGQADPKLSDSDRQLTPLPVAEKDGNENTDQMLLNSDQTDPSARWDNDGLTPLQPSPDIEPPFDSGRVDINARTRNGESPLHCAIRKGNEAMFHTLLEKGAETNVDTEIGESLLHYAIQYGQEAMFDSLFALKTDWAKCYARIC